MTLSQTLALRKYCSTLMVASLAIQPIGAYAAMPSMLSEVPLQGLNLVKPNIMYTMDDSASMFNAYLPDYVGADVDKCLGSNGRSTVCLVTNPPFMSSDFNKIYYDPSIRYNAGKKVDGSDLSAEGANPGTWTSVYVDGFAGYPGPNTGGTTDLATGYLDAIYCTIATPTDADKATAKSDGSVCRYNGVAYGGTSGYRYPNATFGFPQFFFGNAYYYTIASVRFCAAKDANGWGTGTCTPQWTPTSPYVSYGTSGFDPTAFTRVDIVPTTPTYPSGRTYAEEMVNFANWYAFARTRLLATRTAGGIAFSALDQNSRVGFNTLNTFGSKFLNIQDFTPAYKASWFENFYSVTPTGETPSIDAMWRIGEYFSNRGAAAGLPGAIDPLNSETGKCQPNFHLMSTDGYWNQDVIARSGVAGAVGNQDDIVPGSLPGAIPNFAPGQSFPLPYREGPGANSTSNTMADIAMYYWIHDLRPDKPNQVKDSLAPWQHVNFYGLSIGAQGTLAYPTGIDDVASGATPWPKPSSLTPEAIDDLWHAAINSRGKYFNAQNAQQLAESIVSALADFADQAGTGSAVGIAGAQFSTTKKFGYRTSYEVGWWGDVLKYPLNVATGALDVDAAGNPVSPPVWSAAARLDAQVAGTGWDTNRRIVTLNGNTPVPFRYSRLAVSQTDALAKAWSTVQSPPTVQQMIDYLRGDKSNEGTGTRNFRIRSHALGDIVYSGAIPVGAPGQAYTDPGYAAFAASKANRTPTVYVGANDGMLHAFDDSSTSNAGIETWAYVPRALFSSVDPNGLSLTPTEFQLGALTYRRGGIPLFKHKFYVNATPRIWDVDFANTNTPTPPTDTSGSTWHTMLVGALGAGGRAVYALDVTTPVLSTDSELDILTAKHVLWEFTDDDLGYVFDAPTLVKTKRYGWVVLVASGYNNPTGNGVLFVLNPTDGSILSKLSTGTGTSADPSGLSTIRAFTSSRKDPYVLQAYGGDLKGNVWRFDLSDPNASNWKVERIARLTDPAGKAQPITTGVRAEIDQNNNVDRYLFVGTGKLLDQGDLADSSVTNTLYVIRDGTRTAAEAAPSTPYSRSDLNSVNGASVTGFSGPATGRGWYQDASDPKEKIATDVFADVQTVVYSFSKPSDDPCEAALTSNLFARDFLTGNSVIEKSGGTVVNAIPNIGAIAGLALIQGAGGASASASSGDVRVQVTTMKGQVFSFGVKLPGAANSKHRVSWRLLNRN